MELSGRPLLDTRLDRPLYLHRPVHDELLRSAQHGTNTLVIGRRGSGKSTLLHQLAADLRGQGVEVTEVEGRLVTTPLDFLRLVRLRLTPTIRRSQALQALGLDEDFDMGFNRPPSWDQTGDVQQPLEVIRQIQGDLGPERRIVLCDEPPAKVAHTVFGRLRDELWQLPITWIVSGNESDENDYLTPPADAFFERVVRLSGLTEEEQRHLIEIRAGDDAAVLDRLLGASGQTPRDLIRVARASLEEGQDSETVSKAMAALDAKVAGLGRPAAMAFTELRALGSASASDKRFLERVGWTRERATQILNRLESAGVVESFPEQGERGGRPRKVYRVKEAV